MNGYISYIDYVRDLPPEALTSDTGTFLPELSVLRDRRVAYAAQLQTPSVSFDVLIDLGAARQIDVIGLLGMSESDSPLLGYASFYVSSDRYHTGDLYDSTQNTCYRNMIELTGGVVARYVRVVYERGPVDVLKMGRIWIGPLFNLPFDRGWDWQPLDGNQTFRSEGNQLYARKRPAYRAEEFTFSFTADTAFGTSYLDQNTVLDYLEKSAAGLECLICPNARTQHMIKTLSIYGLLFAGPVSHLRGKRHTLSARIEEGL